MPFLPVDHQATGSIAANAQTVLLDVTRHAIATVTLTGTWVGTVQFEVTTDNVTWVGIPVTPVAGGATVTSATANGTWSAYVSAYAAVRLRASAWTSGSVAVAIRASAAGGSLTALTSGSIVFANASGVLAQDNANFFYNSANQTAVINRLSVGSGNAGHRTYINNTLAAGSSLYVDAASNDASGFAGSSIFSKLLHLSTNVANPSHSDFNNVYLQSIIGQQGATPIAAQGGVSGLTISVDIENLANPSPGFSEPVLITGFEVSSVNHSTVANGAGRYQLIQLTNTPTAGTWTLAGNSATTPGLAFNAAASVVQTNVRALGGAYASATVNSAGSQPFSYFIDLGASAAALVGNGASLTGAGAQPGVNQFGNFGGASASTIWGFDINQHGPIGEQPAGFIGLSWFMANHYNGSPSGPKVGPLTLSTGWNNGGGGSVSNALADTYPLDYGFTVQGTSQAAGVVGKGYTYGGLIGSSVLASGVWSIAASRFGTALAISDYDTIGVDINVPYTATTPIALRVLQKTTPVILGASAQVHNSFLEVTGKTWMVSGADADPTLVLALNTSSQSNDLLQWANATPTKLGCITKIGSIDVGGVFGTAPTPTSNNAGDKITMGGGAGAASFGFGYQTNRLVAHVPSANGFAIRPSSGSGNLSSGADAIVLFGDGHAVLNGNLSVGQSATAPDPATGGTIATANIGVARVAPAGAETGMILAVGTIAGQEVTVVNEAVAANSITFAVQATSHVSNGVSTVIAGLTAQQFVWDTGTSLWYPA